MKQPVNAPAPTIRLADSNAGLLPCPFCGDNAEYRPDTMISRDEELPGVICMNADCQCSMAGPVLTPGMLSFYGMRSQEEYYSKLWNMRSNAE